MQNLSDGQSDGVVLFYMKDGVIYPVALTQEQIDMLDVSIATILCNKLTIIQDKPVGRAVNLIKKKEL